jgi:hypothetical protein
MGFRVFCPVSVRETARHLNDSMQAVGADAHDDGRAWRSAIASRTWS